MPSIRNCSASGIGYHLDSSGRIERATHGSFQASARSVPSNACAGRTGTRSGSNRPRGPKGPRSFPRELHLERSLEDPPEDQRDRPTPTPKRERKDDREYTKREEPVSPRKP